MNKHKICIVGDGLSGLMSALALSKLSKVKVDLLSKNGSKALDKRTTAVSESNYKFLKENVNNLSSKLFWPSKNIELFYENEKQKINFLNLTEKSKNLMYIFENHKLKKFLISEIKKKGINVLNKEIKNTKELDKYDLVILCLGRNSSIYEKIIANRSINKDYNEVAITGYVNHNFKKLNTSQFFLKQGPMAILPFSKEKFSFVWSINNKYFNLHRKNIKQIVNQKLADILETKKKFKVSNIHSYPILLDLKKNYYNKNILILGEGLHTIHPVAGQGVNLVLRDIKELKDIIKYYIDLGISLKSSYVLKDFYNKRKPENTIMALGVDATHNFFKKNKHVDPIKSVILDKIKNNETLKHLSKIISNKGLYF